VAIKALSLSVCCCKGPSEARALVNSTMVGIGLTMEGTGQNDVIYEFMLENGWRRRPRDIAQWSVFALSLSVCLSLFLSSLVYCLTLALAQFNFMHL